MLAKGPVSRKRRASKTGVAGKGRYKTWSAEAILRTSFLVSNLIENLQSPTVHFFLLFGCGLQLHCATIHTLVNEQF